MGERHNIFWRLFVERRLGRLEGLVIPAEYDGQGQVLFGAANFLGLLIILMLVGTIPAVSRPPLLGVMLLAIAFAVLLRGVIAIVYYRHIKSWKGFAFYTTSVTILLVIIGILLLG
jgi:hypothetical protein